MIPAFPRPSTGSGAHAKRQQPDGTAHCLSSTGITSDNGSDPCIPVGSDKSPPVTITTPADASRDGDRVPGATPDANGEAIPATTLQGPTGGGGDAPGDPSIAATVAKTSDDHPGFLVVNTGEVLLVPDAGTSTPIWDDGILELAAHSGIPTGRIDGDGTVVVDSGFESPVDAAAMFEQGPTLGPSQHIRFNGPNASLYLAGGSSDPAAPVLVQGFRPTDDLSVFGTVEDMQVSSTPDGDLLALTEIVGGVHGHAETQYFLFDRTFADENLVFGIEIVSTGAFGRGYTNITLQTATACFCPGTLIATPDGDRPVETLRIGDPVSTTEGSRPVLWIGRRSYPARFAAGRPALMPIRIRAGALGHALPRRDLLVSPRHAMLVRGLLVPAGLLVNDRSVVREMVAGDIDYLHLELDRSALLLAEGAPTESFVDDNSRDMFQNAAEYAVLYPDRPCCPPRWCAPRIEDGEQLLRAQHYVDALAGLLPRHTPASLRGHVDSVEAGRVLGWAWCPEHPDAPVLLDILADGMVVAQVLADRYRADLADAGIGAGCHGFEAAVPVGTTRAEVRRARDGRLLAA